MHWLKTALASSALVAAGAACAGPEQDLVLAAKMDDVTTVTRLLAKGLSANVVDPVSGESLLLLALREDSQRVVKQLVAAPDLGLDLAAPNGNTALMMAAYKRNRPAVEALLARGAAVNQSGWTALHYAAAGGDAEIVRLLIKAGANLNARAIADITPLMMAAREGQEQAADALLRAGADANAVNSEGLHAGQVADKADKPRIARMIAPYLKKAKAAN